VRKICKILVVEDDHFVREMLGDVFEDEGYRFLLAIDGAGMRQAIAADPAIDIILIDVTLPGGESGLTLAREAVARGFAVILVSGDHARFEQVERSGYRFLFKPFRIGSLLELVEEVLAAAKKDCERPRAALR
jgi:DNA-binding NtrC family response regulator